MTNKNTQLNFNFCKELLYKIAEEQTNVSKEEIFSKNKTRVVADVRRVIIKILKTTFPESYISALGKTVFRNHPNSSIQLKKHDDLFFSDAAYIKSFNKINDEFLKTYKTHSITDLYTMRDSLEEKIKTTNTIIHKLENE